MLAKKTLVIEFMDAGGFINFQHESVLMNMKLYRTVKHSVVSTLIMMIGCCLCILSIIHIKIEFANKKLAEGAAEMAEGEEGGVGEAEAPIEPGEDGENEEGEHHGGGETAVKTEESLYFIIKTCDGF
jgi:hypothetical protein